MLILRRKNIIIIVCAFIALYIVCFQQSAKAITAEVHVAGMGKGIDVQTAVDTWCTSQGVPQNTTSYDSISDLTISGVELHETGFDWIRTNLINIEILTLNDQKETPDQSPWTGVLRQMAALKIVNLPEATKIGNSTFERCPNVLSVNAPKVISIGEYSFWFCTSLNQATFPRATSLGKAAFEECDALANVDFPAVMITGSHIFYKCDKLELVSMPQLQIIEESSFSECPLLTNAYFPAANTINMQAFYNSVQLKIVHIPNVATINNYAFWKCISLRQIDLPTVARIERGAFEECKSLEEINLPVTLSIGEHAFDSCIALQRINVPKVLNFGANAFKDCTNIKEYYFGSISPTTPFAIGANAFNPTFQTPTYYFPITLATNWPLGYLLSQSNHTTATLQALDAADYELLAIQPAQSTLRLGDTANFTTSFVRKNASAPALSLDDWIQWRLLDNNVLSTIDGNGKVIINPKETNTSLTVEARIEVCGATYIKTAIINIVSGSGGGGSNSNNNNGQIIVSYSVIQVPGEENGFVSICDGPLEKFTRLYIDNVVIEGKYYSVSNGSTKALIKKDFFYALSIETHNIRFEYSDGSASADFIVKGRVSQQQIPTWIAPINEVTKSPRMPINEVPEIQEDHVDEGSDVGVPLTGYNNYLLLLAVVVVLIGSAFVVKRVVKFRNNSD